MNSFIYASWLLICGLERVGAAAAHEPLDSWYSRLYGSAKDLHGIAYGNGTFVAVGSYGGILVSTNGVQWEAPYTGETAYFFSAAWGNGRFVAVGTQGRVLSSTDGKQWEGTYAPGEILSVCYASGKFVAVGGTYVDDADFTFSRVVTSPDGRSWTMQISDQLEPLHAVTGGDKGFVASGDKGRVLFSGDGLAWQTANSGTTATLRGVAYGNRLFVGVGGTNVVLLSEDGMEWSTSLLPGTSSPINGIIFAGDRFIVLQGGRILSSLNGVDWQSHVVSTVTSLYGATYASDPCNVTVVGIPGAILQSDPVCPKAPWIAVEPQSQTNVWGANVSMSATVLGSSPIDYQWYKDNAAIAGANSNLLTFAKARPQDTGTYRLEARNVYGTATSVSAKLRINAYHPFDYWRGVDPQVGWNNVLTVAYDKGLYVAGTTGPNVLVSSNAVDWRIMPVNSNAWFARIIYTNSSFCAVGGGVWQSSNAVDWVQTPAASNEFLEAVIHANGQYIAVGGSTRATVLVSSNGWDWSAHYLPSDFVLEDIAFGNGRYIGVGTRYQNHAWTGAIFASMDAVTWVQQSAPTNALYSVAFGSGRFVAVGYDGVILSSQDGSTWTRQMNPTSRYTDFNRVIFAADMFVAVGYGSAIVTSPDGIQWTVRKQPDIGSLTDAIFANQRIVAVGGYGPIFVSEPLVTLKVRNDPRQLLIFAPVPSWGELQTRDAFSEWQTSATIQVTNNPVIWSETATDFAARFYRFLIP